MSNTGKEKTQGRATPEGNDRSRDEARETQVPCLWRHLHLYSSTTSILYLWPFRRSLYQQWLHKQITREYRPLRITADIFWRECVAMNKQQAFSINSSMNYRIKFSETFTTFCFWFKNQIMYHFQESSAEQKSEPVEIETFNASKQTSEATI